MAPRNAYATRLPVDDQRDHLMVQVAKLYFDMDRTQAQIAAGLGLTRWQVARLLTEAREEGIVRIEITPRAGRRTGLELALQQRFALTEAVVVPMGATPDPALRLEAVAQAAANHLAALSPRPALVGLSWGRTMSAVARALPAGWAPGAHFVLVNGSITLHATSARNAAVAEEFAQSAGGSASLLPVPAILGRAATRLALEDDPVVARVLALAREAPVACFGMGGMGAGSAFVTSGYLTEAEIARLRGLGAVGDILGRFVDAQGRIVDADLDARTIGLPLSALQAKAHRIGITTGPDKYAIAAAALRAGLLTALVTDEATARTLLDASDPGARQDTA